MKNLEKIVQQYCLKHGGNPENFYRIYLYLREDLKESFIKFLEDNL